VKSSNRVTVLLTGLRPSRETTIPALKARVVARRLDVEPRRVLGEARRTSVLTISSTGTCTYSRPILPSRLGYRSEAAFSRAFKRVIGVSPGAVRRNGNPIDAGAPAG